MQYICYSIKELCIELVIKTSQYYDARSEKHQTVTVSVFFFSKISPRIGHKTGLNMLLTHNALKLQL
jgi:hypothetical protein